MPVAWAPPSVRPAPLPAGFPEIYHRDADLPVRFTGPDLKFVERLPFLPWRPELVAAGAALTYQDVAAVELVAVTASLLDFSGLPDDFMVEASIHLQGHQDWSPPALAVSAAVQIEAQRPKVSGNVEE